MDLFKNWFDWNRRINRKKYFLSLLMLLPFYFLVVFFIATFIAKNTYQLNYLSNKAATLLHVFLFTPICIARLHDLNRPAAIALFFAGVNLSVLFFEDALGASLILALGTLQLFYALALLFVKGTNGPNQYGEDPLAKPAPVFENKNAATNVEEEKNSQAKATLDNYKSVKTIEELFALKEKGIITEQEFEEKKSRILKNI